MFRVRSVWPPMAAAVMAACATEQTSSAPTAPRIYEACMGVEVPKAVTQYQQEGKPADDAKIFAHFVCKVLSGICAEAPMSGKCPQHFIDYGLTK